MSGTAEQVLSEHGFTGERLLTLCRKIANELARRGAFLYEHKLEDLVGFLALHGVRAAVRYEPERVHATYGANEAAAQIDDTPRVPLIAFV